MTVTYQWRSRSLQESWACWFAFYHAPMRSTHTWARKCREYVHTDSGRQLEVVHQPTDSKSNTRKRLVWESSLSIRWRLSQHHHHRRDMRMPSDNQWCHNSHKNLGPIGQKREGWHGTTISKSNSNVHPYVQKDTAINVDLHFTMHPCSLHIPSKKMQGVCAYRQWNTTLSCTPSDR